MLTSNQHTKTVSYVKAAWDGDGSLKMLQTQGQKKSGLNGFLSVLGPHSLVQITRHLHLLQLWQRQNPDVAHFNCSLFSKRIIPNSSIKFLQTLGCVNFISKSQICGSLIGYQNYDFTMGTKIVQKNYFRESLRRQCSLCHFSPNRLIKAVCCGVVTLTQHCHATPWLTYFEMSPARKNHKQPVSFHHLIRGPSSCWTSTSLELLSMRNITSWWEWKSLCKEFTL